MGLVEDVVARLDLDPDQAAMGVGTLLFGVRLGLDARTWDQVRDAFPEAGALLGRASTTAGRTAEMVSLTAPGAIRKTLETAGLTEDVVNGLADAVRNALTSHLPANAAGRALTALDRSLG